MNKTISIMTYNTHLFNGTGLNLAPTWQDDQRRDRIIEYLAKHAGEIDVVCLCEVWSNSDREKICEYRQIFQHSYFFNSSATSQGDGLLILSKYKIVNPLFTEFERPSLSELPEAHNDALAEKGFIAACIEIEEGCAFRIFLTHTQADDSCTDIRRDQFKQISDFMKRYHPKLPTILLGDLNVPAFTKGGFRDEYRALQIIFNDLTDTYAAANPTESGFTCDPKENLLASPLNRAFGEDNGQTYPVRYDYIFSQNGQWKVQNSIVIKDCQILIDANPANSPLKEIDPYCQFNGIYPQYRPSSPEGKVAFQCSDHYPLKTTLSLLHRRAVENEQIFSSMPDALKAVKMLQKAYDYKTCNLIILQNNTHRKVHVIEQGSNGGEYYKRLPEFIPPMSYAIALHNNNFLADSNGYFIAHLDGVDADLLGAFVCRYVPTSRNKIFTAIRDHKNWTVPANAELKTHIESLVKGNDSFEHQDNRECKLLLKKSVKRSLRFKGEIKDESVAETVFQLFDQT